MSKSQCWITYSLMEEGCARLRSMTSNDHASTSEEFASNTELAGDVVSHAGVHIGLNISNYINFPHFLG